MLLSDFRSKGNSVFLRKSKAVPFRFEKKSPPIRVVFFCKALLLLNTHLFMLMKRNIAYSGSLDE